MEWIRSDERDSTALGREQTRRLQCEWIASGQRRDWKGREIHGVYVSMVRLQRRRVVRRVGRGRRTLGGAAAIRVFGGGWRCLQCSAASQRSQRAQCFSQCLQRLAGDPLLPSDSVPGAHLRV